MSDNNENEKEILKKERILIKQLETLMKKKEALVKHSKSNSSRRKKQFNNNNNTTHDTNDKKKIKGILKPSKVKFSTKVDYQNYDDYMNSRDANNNNASQDNDDDDKDNIYEHVDESLNQQSFDDSYNDSYSETNSEHEEEIFIKNNNDDDDDDNDDNDNDNIKITDLNNINIANRQKHNEKKIIALDNNNNNDNKKKKKKYHDNNQSDNDDNEEDQEEEKTRSRDKQYKVWLTKNVNDKKSNFQEFLEKFGIIEVQKKSPSSAAKNAVKKFEEKNYINLNKPISIMIIVFNSKLNRAIAYKIWRESIQLPNHPLPTHVLKTQKILQINNIEFKESLKWKWDPSYIKKPLKNRVINFQTQPILSNYY